MASRMITALPKARSSVFGTLARPSKRRYTTEPSPSPSPQPRRQPQTKVGEFYSSFGIPLAKCFLGAIFTYQIIYWSWMKLESLEEQKTTEAEIQQLKEELKVLVERKREAERAAQAEQQVQEKKPARKGWW